MEQSLVAEAPVAEACATEVALPSIVEDNRDGWSDPMTKDKQLQRLSHTVEEERVQHPMPASWILEEMRRLLAAKVVAL